MTNINEFCHRIYYNQRGYLEKRFALSGLTQDITSCKAIIKACIDIEPDYVVEVGTNYGLSTLSLAYALKLLGKDVSDLTTTDISHDFWDETAHIQKDVLENNDIEIKKIQTVTQDFKDLDPHRFIKSGKVLVFYDIHDIDGVSYSRKFLDEWIPLFDHGYVMLHDFNIFDTNPWIKVDPSGLPHSSAKHFCGLSFEGFKECKVVIDWLNESHRGIKVLPYTSILKFQI